MAAKFPSETDPLGNQGGGPPGDILQPGPPDPLSPGQIPPGPPGREVMLNPQPLPPGGDAGRHYEEAHLDMRKEHGSGGPDQPLVGFQGGDPDQPIIVGDLYGGQAHGGGGGPDETIGFQYGTLKTPYTKQQEKPPRGGSGCSFCSSLG